MRISSHWYSLIIIHLVLLKIKTNHLVKFTRARKKASRRYQSRERANKKSHLPGATTQENVNRDVYHRQNTRTAERTKQSRGRRRNARQIRRKSSAHAFMQGPCIPYTGMFVVGRAKVQRTMYTVMHVHASFRKATSQGVVARRLCNLYKTGRIYQCARERNPA